MRELKFRAWKMNNGKLQRYIFDPFAWTRYANNHLDEPIKFDFTTNDIRNFMPDADVIEQYTGLKDKNGKEIYDGDIIQEKGLLSLTCVEWDKNNARYITKVLDKSKCVASVFYFDIIDALKCEVIGNIHENPELCGEEE